MLCSLCNTCRDRLPTESKTSASSLTIRETQLSRAWGRGHRRSEMLDGQGFLAIN
ncbi:hypothetical protein [Aerosakkonema funiforme]|uniref:hypothetical protein n=1 Tax=Aerosakkonema funiforme TaxID=1246630 RepID=UPI001689DF61|nr:hypothetical protein [Aerosakkonema funiforme]